MPRQTINYDSTYFYKFCCKGLNIRYIYVGHTTHFTKRKRVHLQSYINKDSKLHNIKLYTCIRANGGWQNWDMILIDVVKCTDSLEARKKEREYIEALKATLNMVLPSRTMKERKKELYLLDNSKEILRAKLWYENNKDKVLERQAEKVECPICMQMYTHGHKTDI